MKDQLFKRAHVEVSQGCAIAMINIMENVFSECLEPAQQAFYIFEDFFFQPLIGCFVNGTTKTQKNSAAFVLRKLINHIITNYQHLMTIDLSDKIISAMLK